VRPPVGRIAALLAVVVGAWVLARGSGNEPHLRTVASGVEFGKLNGAPFCRQGSPEIGVLRVDPRRVRVGVRHYRRELGADPRGAVGWQRATGALAVFNAGQYYPDLGYMGLLVSRGVAVSPRLHPTFKAALVASPSGGGRRARVLDLGVDTLDPRRPGWQEVAQSFMLFDRKGEIRVRKSAQVAQRTIVAEDRDGRLLAITSEGGYTLYEFAQLLRGAKLDLTHAMSMDGGGEAQLVVRTRGFHYASFGAWNPDRDGADADAPLAPLPAVVVVEALE
jgi:hypothetical protein